MKVLVCETSTLLGSVAVLENGQLLAERKLFRQGSHSDTLNIFIDECLQEAQLSLADIDVFVSGVGPGSFTGLRISLNTIKTFGYIYNKPVWGGNSLYTLAYENASSVLNNSKTTLITSMINAYKNMVYIAQYELQYSAQYELKHTTQYELQSSFTLVEKKAPQVVRVQELVSFLDQPSHLVGDGFLAYENYLQKNLDPDRYFRSSDTQDYPTAATLGRLTALPENQKLFQSWHTLLPLYLRASEAEENQQGIKYQAL